jgi:hypothetical protein
MATSRSTRHRRVFRLAFLTGIVASLFGSLLAVPTAAAASTFASSAPVGPPVPRRWSDCGEGLECATARVPLDYVVPFAQLTAQMAGRPTEPARS